MTNSGASPHLLLQIGIVGEIKIFLAFEAWERVPQRVRNCRKPSIFYRMPTNFKAPELVTSKVSDQTFACVSNRNHGSEAKSADRTFDKPHVLETIVGRNFVNPSSRDPLDSPILSDTRVHVRQQNPSWASVASSFPKVRFLRLLFHRQWQAQLQLLKAAALFLKPIPSKEVNFAEGSPL